MPLYLQQKLLRVLEMREIEPLGSARPVPVDLRIVAATNHPLRELVKQRFRTYPWRGNVRELQNTIEYAVCMCVGEWITENDLPDHMNESMGDALSQNQEV